MNEPRKKESVSTQTQTPSVSRSTRFNHQENTNLTPTLVNLIFLEGRRRHFKILHDYVFSRSKLSLSVVRTKRGPLRLASIFRLLLPLRLRPRGDIITIIIITIIGITGTMKYLRHVPDNTIIHRIPVDPAIVPSRTVELPWSRAVIVCWIRRIGIIIVRPRKRR